jgi:hypothetical protein
MFTLKSKKDNSALAENIAAAHLVLDSYPPHSDEYAKTADQLTKLYALKEPPFRVSADTLAIVVANVLITWSVVGHERANVVTSKFASFLMKAVR